MSVIEKLLAFSLIRKSFSIEIQKKIKKYLKFDFISDVDKTIQYILPLPYYVKKYIHNNNFSLRVLGKLRQFDYAKYRKWFKLASMLNFNSSEISTLLEQVRDIILRDNIEPSELAASMEVYQILDNNLTAGQKCHFLKKKITEYRMPLQTQINTKLQTFSKIIQQDFKGNVRVSWDKNFEDTGISLLFKIPDKQTADEIIKIFCKEKIQSQILEMINITKYFPEEPR
jgi:hypothetical protein